ncbi:hypothetical protein AAII07_04190 [Microvirga sp. 0TCS3.31]
MWVTHRPGPRHAVRATERWPTHIPARVNVGHAPPAAGRLTE